MRAFNVSLLVVIALCGCSTMAPPRSSAPPLAGPATAEEKTAVAESLAVERQWLGAWFQGTPVRIEQRSGGAVTIDVPREFGFDPGQSSVKPPLAAVLDKVAESLRRVPQAYLSLLAAPDDAAGASPLALQRAERVRGYLRGQGVPAARLGKPSTSDAPAVRLRMEAAAPRGDAL